MQRRGSITAMAAMLGLALGCNDALYFDCSDDGQCDLGGAPGVCFAGECAYPNGDCDSGYAYPSQARPPFAGQCVDEAGTLGGTGSTGSTGGSADSIESVDTGDSSADGTESGGPQVEPRCHVVQLDGGDRHSCAVTQDGDVWCWGDNTQLELGVEGSLEGSRTPVKVEALDDVNITSLSVGDDHTCALAAAGGLWCWGAQSNGEIDNENGGSSTHLPTPAPIAVADQIASTNNANCVISGSTLTCWGDSADGQTGLPNGIGVNDLLVGIEMGVVAGGSRHLCAQTQRPAEPWNGVECWGHNEFGRLGVDPALDLSREPMEVVGLPKTPASALALGGEHSCALIEQQTWCWGHNDDSQLLDTGSSFTARRLAMVPLATHLRVGFGHSCARTLEDDWLCWGPNDRGQADPRSTNDNVSSPLSITQAIEAATGVDVQFDELGLGRRHGCGASDETGILCWGENEAEQPLDGYWLGEPVADHPRIGRVTLPDCP